MRSAMRTLEKRCEMSTALALAQLLEALEHLELRARVERRGRLVEDQQLRVAHVGAGDGDLLPLAAGEVDAGAEALADDLVVAARAGLRITSSARLRCGGGLDARAVVARLDAADGDVLGRGQVVAHEVLEDDADVGAQRARGRTRAGRGRRAGCGPRPGRRGAPAASPAWSCRRRSRPPAPAPRRRAA